MITVAAARWRRLDVPGTDECRLTRAGSAWLLIGTATYEHLGHAARLQYQVRCNSHWQTTRGTVQGEIGGKSVHLAVARAGTGVWTVNGRVARELSGLVDLDLGFTPATNLFPLKRLALTIGDSAEAEAAWLDEETWTLSRLPQRYERRSAMSYWYESPTAGYSGLLTVDSDGFVRDYPGLWTIADPLEPL